MEKFVKWALLAVTVVGLIVCIPIYFFQLEPVNLNISDAAQYPVQVTKFNIHAGSDLYGNTTYTLDMTFIPTATTKTDQGYRLVVDNSLTTVDYDIQWNQSELSNNESKTLSAIVSNDQYLVILQQPQYNLVIYEWRTKHDFFLFLPWIITLALFLGFVIFRTIKPLKKTSKFVTSRKGKKRLI